jgi:hypothetical protein
MFSVQVLNGYEGSKPPKRRKENTGVRPGAGVAASSRDSQGKGSTHLHTGLQGLRGLLVLSFHALVQAQRGAAAVRRGALSTASHSISCRLMALCPHANLPPD